MLTDKDAAVDADDVVMGKGLLELAPRLFVVVGLCVGGVEDGSVDDEEIGVGGRESVALVCRRHWSKVLFVDGCGHWERDEPIGLSRESAQLAQFLFHELQFGKMFVGRVGTGNVGNGVVGAEAGKGVDVSVGVVACEIAMMQPKHLSGVEKAEELLLDVVRSEHVVAVGGEQTGGGGEDCATAVGLDAAAFEHEVEVGLVGAGEDAAVTEVAIDAVVVIGCEFHTPPVELEVEQMTLSVVVECGDEGVVACPRVVGRTGDEADVLGVAQLATRFVDVGSDDEEGLASGNFVGNLAIAVDDVGQERCPVGVGMRPRELHEVLVMPFSG